MDALLPWWVSDLELTIRLYLYGRYKLEDVIYELQAVIFDLQV